MRRSLIVVVLVSVPPIATVLAQDSTGKAIRRGRKNAEAGDTVPVFFSGHGFLDAGGKAFSLATFILAISAAPAGTNPKTSSRVAGPVTCNLST